MPTPLRALMVEDVEQDAELVLRELRRGGFDVAHLRVDTAEAMTEALTSRSWDVVLSDYSMPSFGAPMALRVVAELGLDLPFIIISGTVNEEIAVESLRAGAHDFMAKGKLSRLVPAIERELREAALRAERKKLQEQLLISDRMASMGTLAAGVAHEINNPLASVMANLDLATRDLAEISQKLGLATELAEVTEGVGDARDGLERIRSIVRDLKIFSRSEEEVTGPVDLARVLHSTLRMAWNEIRHRARLVKSFERAGYVQATESRLGQVFLNLVINAAQAIEEGHSDDHEIRVSASTAADGFICVAVSDTGPGMEPRVVEHLFTPFFTTKPVGVGTGLGLSICHRIVTGFGGRIEVETCPGRGTTFRVWLPPAKDEVPTRTTNGARRPTSGKRGRVLVIDDEVMVAKAIQRVLSLEHEVVALEQAALALEKIKSGERFDVILCDLMMPQMTGMDLHAELSRFDPELAGRVIFLTGGAFTVAARAFLAEVENQRVEKPFDTQHLRALVNDRIQTNPGD